MSGIGFDEAEPLLAGAHDAFLASAGPDHAHTREAAGHLVSLYEAWNRPEEAASFREAMAAAGKEAVRP